MTNEMKLLRAFIEASGFDVEEVRLSPLGLRGDELIHVNKVINYKVTKKPDPLLARYNGVFLNQLTQNVIDIECDPTTGIDDKWIKYPKEAFDAVIDWFGDDAIRVNEHRYNIFNVEVSLDEEN